MNNTPIMPRLLTLLLLGFLFFSACRPEQPNTSNATNNTTTQPNIAPPTKTGIQEDYENTERVVWQKPSLIMDLLSANADLKGKTIADIGAGTGFFTLRLAERCDKVVALDIDQFYLNFIDSIKTTDLAVAFQKNIETRLTPRDSALLSRNEVDAVLIVNTFMYIENQAEYLRKLKTAIKSGGRLVIVDFKRKRTELGPLPREKRTPLYVVEDLLYETGYTNIQAIDTELAYQYIAIAEIKK